jgi:hypothetical protein
LLAAAVVVAGVEAVAVRVDIFQQQAFIFLQVQLIQLLLVLEALALRLMLLLQTKQTVIILYLALLQQQLAEGKVEISRVAVLLEETAVLAAEAHTILVVEQEHQGKVMRAVMV